MHPIGWSTFERPLKNDIDFEKLQKQAKRCV